MVSMAVPPGWSATPSERPFSLAPGAHLAFDAVVSPGADAVDGRYFVAARIEDEAGQLHEDVVTIDLSIEGTTRIEPGRSHALERAVGRTMRRAALIVGGAADGRMADAPDEGLGRELAVTLLTPEVRVPPGDRGELRLSLRNDAASEIRGEAQLISPHETWSFTSPWTQGFAVGPGEESTLSFAVHPRSDVRAGTWWGLVKVMWFGRLWYAEAAIVEVLPAISGRA